MESKISIIIPTYNREKVIAKTLDSVLAQTFEDWECLVIDDHSTDSTWKALEEYTCKSPKIRIFKNEKTKGACGARNTGLYKALGDYVIFFDCDDYMNPNMLESLYNKIKEGYDIVTCWTRIIDINTRKKIGAHKFIIEGKIHYRLLSGEVYVNTDCALIKRDNCIKIEGWDENCPSYQEWDFHLRLSKNASYSTIQHEYVEYYVGSNDAISKNGIRAIMGRLYILKKYEHEFIRKAPLSLFKYTIDVYSRLKIAKEDKKNEKMADAVSLYNKSIKGYIRFIVCLTYPVIKFLKKW